MSAYRFNSNITDEHFIKILLFINFLTFFTFSTNGLILLKLFTCSISLYVSYLYVNIGGFLQCQLGPFQPISYSHNEPAMKFIDQQKPTRALTNCSLLKALVKFPHKVKFKKLKWLNKSYVDLAVLNKTLYFKVRRYIMAVFVFDFLMINLFLLVQWKRSVSRLQGAILTLNLRCFTESESYKFCLRAKVVGAWKAGN